MKKIISVLLMVCMLLTLCSCGEKGDSSDPALGVYNGVSTRMFGSTSDMSEVYGGTNTIELKKNGKCVVTLESDSVDAEYTLEGETLDIIIEGASSPGTLKDNVLTIDFMELGMELIFVKDGAEIPDEVLGAAAIQNDDPNLIIGENSEARYLESKIVEDANGDDAIAAYFDFTVTGEEAESFGWAYFYTMTQGDQELESTTVFLEDYTYLGETVFEDVAPGENMEVCLTYTLLDTTTPVVITFTDLFDTVLQVITVDLAEVEVAVSESGSTAGYYTLYSFEQDGEVLDFETIQMIGMDKTTYVVFDEDGTGRINFDGDETDLTYDEDTIYNIGGDMNYYFEGEYLTILTGNLVFTYQKSDEEPPEPGSVQAAGTVSYGGPFPEHIVAEFEGDWHGMAVVYDATGDYESNIDQEMEIIARFEFDEYGNCVPYLAVALTGDSGSNFEITGVSYNENSDGMMLSGSFIDEELEDYSNAYTYYGAMYVDAYIDDGDGNYMNLYACLKPLDAQWDEEVDYPFLPADAVEFYQGMSFEEIVELFGLDPADLPSLY